MPCASSPDDQLSSLRALCHWRKKTLLVKSQHSAMEEYLSDFGEEKIISIAVDWFSRT
ncbi:MAG TPA: hypothetical protein VFF11_05140 [Candidatus Binatia bacterium]|nr:hypothetical protein [Candidatus Binatia bacterium]